MMNNGVQIISTEVIKPTPQLPHRLKTLKLSYLDRILPPVYVPLIFFYKPHQSSNPLQISHKLKHSLLDILPSFYPLAGRLHSNDFVHCNDAGVEFIHARLHAHLNDFLHLEDLKHFIPPHCTTFDHGQRPLLVVQTTFLDCGGLVVSVCISHKIGDLASAMAFLNAWAARCRGGGETELPELSFGTSNYFPPFSFFPYSMFIKLFESNDEFVTKTFVFENEKLEILKRIATSSPESVVKDPSRVELVSAFIWKHFMAAPGRSKGASMFAAIMAVSLRARTSPPGLLENVFGNCFMSPFDFDDSSGKFHELISKLRRSIRRVEGDYITKPLNEESYVKDLGKMSILLLLGKVEWCYFTSWRGFPVYELDYGWGKPVWFSTSSMPIKNLVILLGSSSSKSGGDVEAIVTMKQEDLQVLEAQINLISTHTSVMDSH